MTTYIKRVQQFKAVQYKMEDKVLAELFELVPNLTSWKIDDCGLTLTHTVIKLGEDTRQETLRLRAGDFSDWLVRSEKGDLSVLSGRDFNAQYEAAPEAKVGGTLTMKDYKLSPQDVVRACHGIANKPEPRGKVYQDFWMDELALAEKYHMAPNHFRAQKMMDDYMLFRAKQKQEQA